MGDVRARVQYDPRYLADSIIIYKPGQEVVVWENGHAHWRPMDRRVDMENPPVDKLVVTDEEVLRALYEALADHFGGSGHDTRALRKDYEHEKGRVDKLIDGLLDQPQAVMVNGEHILVARGNGSMVHMNHETGEHVE
jgi:hypothetical protein